MALLIVPSCSQQIGFVDRDSIQTCMAPATGREYLLYRPSAYKREQSWPLVVVCPPSSPKSEIRRWTGLAEENGFLVAVPELERSGLRLLPDETAEPRNRRDNETQILSVVEHIRGGHNISEDRIFIYGADRAGVAALRTGLKHADMFRAVAVVQPAFDRAQVADVGNAVDPYQPVYLNFRSSNLLTGKQGRECADWLRGYGADLRLDVFGAPDDLQRIVSFFQDVLRTTQWIHVRATPAESGNPLEVRFSLRIKSSPAQYRWQFGDGAESPIAEPVHAYDKPGTYRVTVTVSSPTLGEHTRLVNINVPMAATAQLTR